MKKTQTKTTKQTQSNAAELFARGQQIIKEGAQQTAPTPAAVPDWVNDTLTDHTYSLEMYESSDQSIQSVDMTRAEYIAMKEFLATKRGYSLGEQTQQKQGILYNFEAFMCDAGPEDLNLLDEILCAWQDAPSGDLKAVIRKALATTDATEPENAEAVQLAADVLALGPYERAMAAVAVKAIEIGESDIAPAELFVRSVLENLSFGDRTLTPENVT